MGVMVLYNSRSSSGLLQSLLGFFCCQTKHINQIVEPGNMLENGAYVLPNRELT